MLVFNDKSNLNPNPRSQYDTIRQMKERERVKERFHQLNKTRR